MARKQLDMDALKNAFSDDKGNGTGGGGGAGKYYNFFNMGFDESCTVRFLPDLNEDNNKFFLVEKKSHRLYINGKNENIPCLTMYGKDCPICDVSRGFYDEDNKDEGKKYYRKVQHIGQVLIRKDPMEDEDGESLTGQVKAISINWQVYKIIRQAFADGELDAHPYDFEEGTDFIIKKSKNGEWADYTLGTKFARRDSALTDEEMEVVGEAMVDLSEYLPDEPKLEIVEAKLAASLNGTSYNDSKDDSDDDDTKAEDKKAAKAKPKKKAKKVVEDEEETEEEETAAEVSAKSEESDDTDDDNDDNDDDDGDDNPVLRKIRERRAAQKKAS